MSETAELLFDWNAQPGVPQAMPIELDDETLRDGLQSPSVLTPDLETKQRCLRYMAQLGVQRVNVGLPMSSQIHDIRVLLGTIRDEALPLLPGLAVRTLIEDLETVARLRDEFPTLPIRANAFLGASRIRRWVEGWSGAKVIEMATTPLVWARERGIPVMFVTEDTSRSHPEDLRDVYLAAANAGAREVCIADTVGHALPSGTNALVRFVRKCLDEAGHTRVRINWHGHSDRGVALANCLAALDAGVDVIHATILGIGERSGNAPLDLLLVNLKLLGKWPSPMEGLRDYVDIVSRSTGVPIPIGYPMFGRDAFRTATGVHAAAIMKAQATSLGEMADLVYSAVPAALIGRSQEIEIGPLSGRSNIVAWLQAHGFPQHDEGMIERVRERALASDRVLTEHEIRSLL